MVLLKRLSDAQADGDRVLAVIKGSAVNQDGRSNGLTAPNSLSQQAVITAALANAGIAPAAVDVVEAHGTGTPLGDPIEVEALAAVFGPTTGRVTALGSVKANIGHTEGASGVAGLIKSVLSLRAGEVAPMVHFRTLNPHISLAGTPLTIPTEVSPWPNSGGERVAGISSFGWSGTNAHVVIAEAPAPGDIHDDVHSDQPGDRVLVLPISARSDGALHDLAAAHRALLSATSSHDAVLDICATAALRRSHHDHRLVAIGRSGAELVDALDAHLAGHEHRGLSAGVDLHRASLLVFVFPGQGSQWAGMARDLMAHEPVFRAAVDRCHDAMAPFVEWSLVDVLSDPTGARLDEIDIVQPALFAMQVALVALWQSLGVTPDAVVGHSMGEVAAAYAAGSLSLDDAARVICVRSRLLRSISGRGAMAVVDLDDVDAGAAIAGFEDRLSIAVRNSRTSTVLSGDPDAARRGAGAISSKRARSVAASTSTSRRTARRSTCCSTISSPRSPPSARVPQRCRSCRRSPPTSPMGATSTATTGLATSVNRCASPSRSRRSSPTGTLGSSRSDRTRCSSARSASRWSWPSPTASSWRRCIAIPTARWMCVPRSGALHSNGLSIDWAHVQPARRPADLPAYPWQRERHWLDEPDGGGVRRGAPVDALLGWRVPIADADTVQVWENRLTPHDLATVTGGDVEGFSAAVLVELLLRAAALLGSSGLRDVQLDPPVHLAGAATTVQVVADLRPDDTVLSVHTIAGARRQRLAQACIPTRSAAPAAVGSPLSTSGLPASAGRARALAAALQHVCALAADGGDRFTIVSIGAIDAPAGAAHDDALLECRLALAAPVGTRATTRAAGLELVSQQGAPVCTATEVVVQLAELAEMSIGEMVHEVTWRSAPAATLERSTPVTRWVVATADGSPMDALCRELGGAGLLQLGGVVPIDDALAAAAGSAPGEHLGVVFVASGAPATPDSTPDAVPDATAMAWTQVAHVAAVLRLAAAMDRRGDSTLWVATSGAHCVVPGDLAPGFADTTLWGAGRAIGEELPHLWGGCIELDGSLSQAAESLAHELTHVAEGGPVEGEVALRGDQRFVARLVPATLASSTPLRLGADSTTLLTGAFGAVGREVARWLVEEGARRLLLVGRTALAATRPVVAARPRLPGGTTRRLRAGAGEPRRRGPRRCDRRRRRTCAARLPRRVPFRRLASGAGGVPRGSPVRRRTHRRCE